MKPIGRLRMNRQIFPPSVRENFDGASCLIPIRFAWYFSLDLRIYKTLFWADWPSYC